MSQEKSAAAELVVALEQLRNAVARAGTNHYHCREDHEPIAELHGRACGLAAACHLEPPPPLEQAGLRLTKRIYVGAVNPDGSIEPFAYKPVRGWMPNEEKWQEWQRKVQHTRAAARAMSEASRPSGEELQYVTLDQIAAYVKYSKRTLERAKSRKKNPLPLPAIDGGGGKRDEWLWHEVRPWLEQEYGKRLPERFPSLT
jgi:hypothetical protein